MITRRGFLWGGAALLAAPLRAQFADHAATSLFYELEGCVQRGRAWLSARQAPAGWWFSPDHPRFTLMALSTLPRNLQSLSTAQAEAKRRGVSWLQAHPFCQGNPGTLDEARLLVWAADVMHYGLPIFWQARTMASWFEALLEEGSPAEWPLWWAWSKPTAVHWQQVRQRQNVLGGWSGKACPWWADDGQSPFDRRPRGELTAAVLNGFEWPSNPTSPQSATLMFRGEPECMQRGTSWLSATFSAHANPGGGSYRHHEYLAHVALCFLGRPMVAPPKWAHAIALQLINSQHASGAWSDDRTRNSAGFFATCFALRAAYFTMFALAA